MNYSSLLNESSAIMDTAVITPKKDHRHTIVPPGKYYAGIQTRFDPLENMKKNVTD